MLSKYPPSSNAAQVIASQYDYGGIVEKEKMHELLEIRMPSFKGMSDQQIQETVKQRELLILSRMSDTRQKLLDEYKIDLKTVKGDYMLVLPKDQTSDAMKEYSNTLRRAGRKAKLKLINVNHAMLSAEESKENSEAIAKLALLKRTTRKALGFSHNTPELANQTNQITSP